MSATAANDVDSLNSLLRGEISAVETYEQAIPKFESGSVALELRRIRDEHQQTVNMLTAKVRSAGGEPSKGSGPWGVFATAVTGTAKVLGQSAVLAALKQGEEHGINSYKKSLEDVHVTAGARTLISSDLLPRCNQHLAALDRLSGSLEGK